ncbi:hypothetical protein [Cognatishimia maritima]|uniref:Uncharacterized membrane protein n=1 Tax=Cognatishimia maritima TaxID=870908 RepID=A0A1M5NCZ1_9RHOB|nr:hypothetical protein [Cognatishimia maritima]SHG87378.1 Uncharacterized membrane protein [Cognatishimia maritima]
MTILGVLHLTLMISVFVIGVRVFATRKGTGSHKRLGRIFVAMMVVSNLAVFGIYEDSATLGIFHYLAIVSLISLFAAIALLRWPGVSTRRRIMHGHVMLWTFGGVVAAGLGQGATALGYAPWPAIALTFLAVGLVAVRFDFGKAVRGG